MSEWLLRWNCGVCGTHNSEPSGLATEPDLMRPRRCACYACGSVSIVDHDARRAVRVRTMQPAGIPSRDRRRDDVARALMDAVDLNGARNAWLDASGDADDVYRVYVGLRRRLQAAGRYDAARAAMHAAWDNLEAQMEAAALYGDDV